MRIGFIGSGKNARTMARHMLFGGHEVCLCNSRGPQTLSDVIAELGPRAEARTRQGVLDSDVVILAVNWVDVKEAVSGLDWHGKILVDATNAHSENPPDMSAAGISRSRAALGGRTSSEIVRELVPNARVVKSISNIPMAWIDNFGDDKPRTTLFTAGDDEDAKQVVIDLLNQVGFAGLDLGSLAQGGAMFDVGGPLSGTELHFARAVNRKKEKLRPSPHENVAG